MTESVMKLQRVQLKCKNLHEYLRGLSPGILDRLYNHPATCLAVLRELPGLAKNYVMRMLFLEQPLRQAAVALWVKKEYVKEQEESSDILLGLRLWHTQLLPGGLEGIVLNPIFKENLRIALLGGGKAWSDDTSQLGPDKHARDVPSLDKYAEERWEVILHFMVGSPSAAVSQDLAQLLIEAGLMKSSEPGEPPCITSSGFQFLLLDTSSQLWYFMLQYLQSAETRGMDLVEILSFLFQLSFSTLGKDYSVEGMSDSLLNFLQHLREFGLVFQRKRKSRRYYPTRLAINLSSGISGTTVDTHNQGFIVVETNYRIYAYTDSELQIALIALFSEMLYRFPNLVVAQVTRESTQQAIANGITADQIIHFLRTRAHAVMLKQTPVLPPTITDQIRLWELERDRLRFSEGPSTLPTVAMFCQLCPSLWCCLLLLLFPLASSSASNGDAVVITSSGPIKGKHVLAGSGSVTAYLGIPYAEPPLGKLRFQKPLPHQPWTQTLEATSFGDSCPQFIFQDVPEAETWTPKTPLSEDCLSLNIWVPHPQPSSPVPVLVWIHGGGYFMSSSSLDVLNGASLAATENVIVVSANYRLGALGFFYLPPAAPGNLGLWDQQLALRWIKENAAAFGGDPSRVTIVGNSAGGSSVNFHLLASKSQDLFAQAVMQSGTANAFWSWRSPAEAKQLSLEFAHLLGCSEDSNTSILHCLETKNVSEFIRHEIALFFKGGYLLNFPFRPTVDGDFLLGAPEKLMEEGQIQVKPVLIGKTSDEGASFVPYVFSNTTHNLINQEQLLKGIGLLVPNATEDFVQTIALKFSEGNQGPTKYRSALSHFYTDRVIACPLIEAARYIRKMGSPVYAYLFTHRPSRSVWPEWVGATHGAEVPYVLGTLESVLPVNQRYTEAEARLSRKMMQYWAEFARTGNPAGLVATEDEWPLYNATEQNFFLLNTEPFQQRANEHCDFLKS